MNKEPKNATITLYNLDNLKAEIFWHTIICQKIVDSYREDLPKKGTKGHFHDLLFTDIGKALSGNVYIEVINENSQKYKAISYYKKNHYQTFFYLRKRKDCGKTNFIVIASIYKTYHRTDHEKFEDFQKRIQEKYKKS
jgi:hypothetical protein